MSSVLLASVAANGDEFVTAGKSYMSLDAGVAVQSGVEVKEIGGTSVNGADLKFNPGLRIDAGAGYHFTERFSGELSVGYVFNSVDEGTGAAAGLGRNGDLFQVPVMVNLLYKVQSEIPIEPFLGAGVGGVLSVFSSTSTTEEFAFGYQGFLGAKYKLSEQTELTVVYKILGTTDLAFKGFETGGTLTHTFAIGLRYSF